MGALYFQLICFHDGQEMTFDFFFGEQADEGMNQFAIPEKQHRRNVPDAELLSGQGVFVHIQLDDFDPPRVFEGQFFKNGAQGPAGTAPGRPAVDQNGTGERQHLPQKRTVHNIHGLMLAAVDNQRRTATSAQGRIVQPVFRHAIFRAASQTPDDHIIERRMTAAARGMFLEPALWNTIFRSTVKAANYNVVILFHEKARSPVPSCLQRILDSQTLSVFRSGHSGRS